MPAKKKVQIEEPSTEKVDVIKAPKVSKRKPKCEDINATVEKGGEPPKLKKEKAPKPEKRTCAGKTKKGENCRRNVKGDATHCSIHA
jgi:hypothetical protein